MRRRRFPRKKILAGICHFWPSFFQFFHGSGKIALPRPSNRKFRHHKGETQYGKKYKIEENKNCTTVISCDIRKSPYISQTDGTPCSHQQKAQSCSQLFSCHIFSLSVYVNENINIVQKGFITNPVKIKIFLYYPFLYSRNHIFSVFINQECIFFLKKTFFKVMYKKSFFCKKRRIL